MTTPQQQKIYEFIECYIAEHNYSPSLQEIAVGIGISPRSISLISRGIHALAEAGRLTFYKNGYRNIQLIPPSSLTLPLLGRIAAGVPIEAIADNRAIDVGALLQGEGLFVLEVKGDSMIDEGILDGDLVICKPATSAIEGEIVVALIDHEATLKRLSYKQKGKITLIPSNTKLLPQVYSPDVVQIQGIFVGLLRLKK
ncbi:MAG: transcriptional repressor LexA [Gammaproteobacteria bacterium]|nr:transcriptional repressor LexA [Gammaproteobacteria bacterium]